MKQITFSNWRNTGKSERPFSSFSLSFQVCTQLFFCERNLPCIIVLSIKFSRKSNFFKSKQSQSTRKINFYWIPWAPRRLLLGSQEELYYIVELITPHTLNSAFSSLKKRSFPPWKVIFFEVILKWLAC